jgi:hypothetical protein
MELRFYKAPKGTWWLDSPEFIAEGNDPSRLQMVAGADEMLENLSEDGKVVLEVSEKKLSGHIELIRIRDIPVIPGVGGQYYYDTDTEVIIWLCDVTLWIFKGVFPDSIWYKKL